LRRALEEDPELIVAAVGVGECIAARGRLTQAVGHVNALIDERLKVQEAERLELEVTAEEIQNSVARVEAQNGMPAGGFADEMQSQGIDPQTAYAQFEADIAWFKVIRSSMAQDVIVTDEEIDLVMERLVENQGKPESFVYEIYLQAGGVTPMEDMRELAFRLVEQARNGTPFDALARQFSQSPTAAVGGELGWVHEGELEPVLDREIRRLEPGTVSDPIRVPGGYYVIQVADRRATAEASPLRTIVTMSQIFLMTDGPKALPDSRLAQLSSAIDSQVVSCEQMNSWADEVGGPASGPVDRVRIGGLPPLVRDAVVTLPEQDVSAPINLNGARLFVMVCSREEDTGLPTEEQIYQRLENEKLNNMARQRLRDLRRQALIEVRL